MVYILIQAQTTSSFTTIFIDSCLSFRCRRRRLLPRHRRASADSLAAPSGETYRTPLYREISVFKRFRTPALSPAVSRYDPYFVKGESRYVVLILEFFWEEKKICLLGEG